MELSIRSVSLFISVALTGLSAGLFYAWSVSAIPGTLRVTDLSYLETMRSINRAILNPAFFLTFFGSLLFLILSTMLHHKLGVAFWLLLSATIIYAGGTFGVTVFGNVPLNDQLELLNIAELDNTQATEFRQFYELRWNRLHQIRMVFSVLAFLLSLMAIFTYSKH